MGEWEDVSQAANNRCPGFTVNAPNTATPPVAIAGSPVVTAQTTAGCLVGANLPDTDMWGVKPFIQGNWWNGVGKTIFYGEYAQYNDFFGLTGGVGNTLPVCTAGSGTCSITGSELERIGAGVVQEIDAAAMHLWLRWQHQELDVNLVDTGIGARRNQGFDDFDLFQAGGIWFF
jgi:hypothetical protein